MINRFFLRNKILKNCKFKLKSDRFLLEIILLCCYILERKESKKAITIKYRGVNAQSR